MYKRQIVNSSEIFDLNKYYLLNIWSSWCVPCREEHPVLMELKNNDRLKVIGMNYKDNKDNAKNFLKELGNPYDKIIFDKKISNALKNINYCPILVFHFGLEKKHIKENIDGFGVLTKKSDNMSFLGVLFNSRIFPHVAPKNNDLITVMIGGGRQSKLIYKDRSKLKNTVIKQIRKMISYNGRIVMEKEFLWRNGIPQYDLNHTDLIKCISEFEKNKILGDAYGLDQEFFDFLRTMQACKDTFGDTEMSMVIAPGQVCEKFFGEIDIQN